MSMKLFNFVSALIVEICLYCKTSVIVVEACNIFKCCGIWCQYWIRYSNKEGEII